MRKIESVYAPHETHWVGNGFRVHNFIPSGFGFRQAILLVESELILIGALRPSL